MKLKPKALSALSRAAQKIASFAQWSADRIAELSGRIEQSARRAEVDYWVSTAMRKVKESQNEHA